MGKPDNDLIFFFFMSKLIFFCPDAQRISFSLESSNFIRIYLDEASPVAQQ